MATVNEFNPKNFEYQNYNVKDDQLISSFNVDTVLTSSSCIEFFIFDLNGEILNSRYDYQSYQVFSTSPNGGEGLSQITINPGRDTNSYGFSNGQYTAYYNFLTKQIGDYNDYLYVKEISSDRTEIKLDSNILDDFDLVNQAEDFISLREGSPYFLDFFLNFGNNQLIISNNIKIVDENTSDPSILVKLYEPLPSTFSIKDQVWVVTEFAEPRVYNINNTPPVAPELPSIPFMQGPNFAIPVKNQVNNSSQNLSYNDIISSASTSSQNQIESLLEESSINISVDYTDFKNFIHFSTVETRINNFYYKTSLIEDYTNQSNNLANITGSSTSQLIIKQKISNIIKNFDKFEYFMYYSSGSMVSYPKSTTEPPYTLMSTGSAEVLTWLGSTNENSGNFGGLLLSASNFDNENPDQLLKSIPEYLREDPANQPYDLFVDMVAQYYDNIWLYTKDITQKYNADNRLDFGVSKDLVSDAIKDFGVKLYQNNFSNQELYTAFLGMTPEGSLFPFPEITGSMPAPAGFEFVDTLISASNDVISMDDTNKSLYKRIYHNIPYLLKSKGTITGLRALITSYGIPDTILKISEFGGKDQVNANDYDLYFNNFNYALEVGPNTNSITSSLEVNSDWNSPNNLPATVQFRFKPEKFPPTNLSQSLWTVDGSGNSLEITLEYSGSGLVSGSYDGSIKDPYYQYANLKLYPDSATQNSASVYLPFFDNGWWNVMATYDGSEWILSSGNKIYNGNNGTSLGYYASSSITGFDVRPYNFGTKSSFASGSVLSPTQILPFSGSLQEIRYYNTRISESVFKDFIMNPLSFEGNGVNSAPDQLIFRAALGSELDINTSSSIHPKVTGSWTITSSFGSDSNFYFNNIPSYSKNIETFFLDQPAVGIKNRITDKIRSENDTLVSGSVLSPIRSLSQTIEASASYTDNINYLEVAFSPQNQINDDIIGQMGHFNVGDYIGDPRQRFTGNNYPDLNNLSEDYFKKYIKQYDLVDFVRLIKFFDNSLFKMIKDFIPARTSLASGLVIKQHLLERNKYPQPQISYTDESELSGSIQVGSFSGGAAGMFNPYNVSYDLDYFSGSMPIQTNVSGSSTGNTFNNLDTSINGLSGTFITNAGTGSTKFPFFDSIISSSKSYVPNLWVELQDNSGNLIANAFNSGSNGIPFDTDVSGSGELTMYSNSNNQFTVSNFNSNADDGINFLPFINEGYIQTTEAIFDNGSGTPIASSSISSIGATLTTTFPTASVITNVSASLTSVTNNFGGGFINRYDIGGSTTNASTGLDFTLFEGGYVSSSVAQFRDPVTGNATDKSPIQIIGSGGSNALRTVYLTSSIFTNVTAIATGVNATSGNTFNTPTVTTGATTSSIFTSSPSYVSSSGDIFIDPSGSSTNVSASGVATFGNPSNPGGLLVSSFSTNATDLNFSGFDDGNAYISCSADGTGHYPFSGGSEFGSGIAPIISATNINMSVSITGRNLGYNPQGGVIPFAIMSGSAATNDTFISQSSGTSSKSPITSINSNFSNLETEFVTSSLVENYNLSFTATPSTSGATPKRWGSSAVVTNIPGGLASNAVIQPSTRGFIKATQTGNPNVNKDVFEDGSGNPTHVSDISSLATGTDGIRPVFDINSTTMPADENFNFIIMTGSISDVNNAGTIFVTTIPNPNITNETFTIYKGEMSDTPPTTTFISSSGRPLTETQMEIYSGSISLTPPTQTFPSASARVISNVNFNFHTGSVTQPGSTTFIQTTIPPEVHDRAYISSISSNTLNLDTHYSINPVGATATGFEFYNDEFGSINYFISNSILDISKMDFYNLNPQYPLYPNVTQSYSITTPSMLGDITRLHWSQDEFYNGELSGSNIEVTNGELNPHCEQFKNPNFNPANYKLRLYYEEEGYNEGAFLSNQNDPFNGFIQLFYGTVPASNLAPESPASANPPSSS